MIKLISNHVAVARAIKSLLDSVLLLLRNQSDISVLPNLRNLPVLKSFKLHRFEFYSLPLPVHFPEKPGGHPIPCKY